MKLKPVLLDGSLYGYRFECPGCDHGHVFYVAGPLTWSFDGNLESPTFSPSLLNRWNEGEARTPRVCHLFLHAGRIEYCGDSTHALAGKTVDLPDIPSTDEGSP